MADCFFCGDFVGEINGDGGTRGRTVGRKDICEQCLGELKHWLNASLPRSPGMREKKLEDEDENQVESDKERENSEEVIIDEEPDDDAGSDPFSSGAKI